VFRHLIADHLGWFKDSTDNGRMATVEDILRERGEEITRGTVPIEIQGVQIGSPPGVEGSR
jgi:hypothetical protein